MARSSNIAIPTVHAPAVRRVVRLRRESTEWRVESSLVDAFFDQRDLRLDYWIATGAATIVKTGPHRTVYRLELPAGRFFLKQYKTGDWKARAQNLFRPCKAMLEWNAAIQVARAGVPTIEPVAVGRVLTGPFVADSFLITPEISRTASLHDFVLKIAKNRPDWETTPFRQSLARQLGELVGRLHRHELIHRDLHVGNILLSTSSQPKVAGAGRSAAEEAPASAERVSIPQTPPSLWLIDLHAVHTQKGINLKQIERNLSLLGNFFSHFATASDRRRFFEAYWKEFRPEFAVSKEMIRRIEAHFRRALVTFHKKADRKWRRGNRRLLIADTAAVECRGLAEIGIETLRRVRDAPEMLSPEMLSPVDLPAAVGELTIGDARRQVIVTSGGADFDARKVWETGHALLRRGISVVRPLLFVAPRASASDDRRQFLVTEHVPGAVPLSEWLNRSGEDFEQTLRGGLLRLADELRKIHAAGFVHIGLSSSDVHIVEDRVSTGVRRPPRPILAGIQGIRRQRTVAHTEIADAIAGLPFRSLRRTHRLRFLKRLLKDAERTEWRAVWRLIAQRRPEAVELTRMT